MDERHTTAEQGVAGGRLPPSADAPRRRGEISPSRSPHGSPRVAVRSARTVERMRIGGRPSWLARGRRGDRSPRSLLSRVEQPPHAWTDVLRAAAGPRKKVSDEEASASCLSRWRSGRRSVRHKTPAGHSLSLGAASDEAARVQGATASFVLDEPGGHRP